MFLLVILDVESLKKQIWIGMTLQDQSLEPVNG